MTEDTTDADVGQIVAGLELLVEGAIGVAVSSSTTSLEETEARIREARRSEEQIAEIHEALVTKAAAAGEPWASFATRTGDALALLRGYLLGAAMTPVEAALPPVEVRRMPNGDPMLYSGTWRAGFVRAPWAPGDPGGPGDGSPRWSLAARNGSAPLVLSSARGVFLDHEPTEAEILSFLRRLQAAPGANAPPVRSSAWRKAQRKRSKR